MLLLSVVGSQVQVTVIVNVVNWLTVLGAPWWGKLEAPAQCLATMAREK